MLLELRSTKLFSIIELIRVKQWIKNFFVFGALIFSYSFLDINKVIMAIVAFILFCLASSTVYIMNDILDVEKDKVHPKKKFRPIACGRISVKEGLIIMLIIFIATFVVSYSISKSLTVILGIYIINNILYSFKVKHIVILDVISIAFGFILRVIAGGVAIGVGVSHWIVLCTFFISLFLGFEKRSNELCKLEGQANKHREILDEYSKELLSEFINVSLTCTLVTYALYTFFAYNHSYMMVTNIFVVYGLFRYKYLVTKLGIGGSPTEAIIADKSIIINVVLWALTSVCILLIFK